MNKKDYKEKQVPPALDELCRQFASRIDKYIKEGAIVYFYEFNVNGRRVARTASIKGKRVVIKE